MTRPGHRGEALQRFNEHVCRVSDAQMLPRLGLPLETVQPIGRWGSDAINCQGLRPRDTARPRELTLLRPNIDKPRQVHEMVKHYLETLRNKFWIVNTATGVVHLPGSPEINAEHALAHHLRVVLRIRTSCPASHAARWQAMQTILSSIRAPT